MDGAVPVCPGCYAIDDEPHAPWCPDDAIERDREERAWRENDYDPVEDDIPW